jgi:hypothetical protein
MLLRQGTSANGTIDVPKAQRLLSSHPLVITSFVEDFWRQSTEGQKLPGHLSHGAWSEAMTKRIQRDFIVRDDDFKITDPPQSWDHLIYAYLIENTGIFDIFAKVMERYCFCEDLGRMSPESQLFLRTTQALIFSNPPPTTIWNVTGWGCPDEISQRMSAYWWMFGIELNHAADIAVKYQYAKPAGANVDFIETFEALARTAWRGIVNVNNVAGPNDTDNQAILSAARRLFCMFADRRQDCNLARQEFRAVAVMSWLHLAVSFDSPIVIDLGAEASCTEERLYRIARRVGMTAHPRSQALFALAQPFSELLRYIENPGFDARNLYRIPGPRYRDLLETVIGNYSIAMGRDAKALPVTLTEQVRPLIQLSPRRTTHLRLHG